MVGGGGVIKQLLRKKLQSQSLGTPVLSWLSSKKANEDAGFRAFALMGAAGITGLLSISTVASADEAEHGLECPNYPWPHDGILSSYDHASIRRGHQVYQHVCASCHSMSLISYRDLVGVSYTEEEAKAMAAEIEVVDGPNDEGEMFTRPGKLSDRLPQPYSNESAARFANGGAYPPDLSLIREGLHYDPYFPGGAIAMPKMLNDEAVEYEDGTLTIEAQMGKDVVSFLSWAAEPEMEERKLMVFKWIFLLSLALLQAAYYRRLKWSVAGSGRRKLSENTVDSPTMVTTMDSPSMVTTMDSPPIVTTMDSPPIVTTMDSPPIVTTMDSPRTKLDYQADMFKLRSQARFVSLSNAQDGRTSLILDSTVFHPQGGGQPSDTGLIEFAGLDSNFYVQDVRSKDGIILHYGVFEGSNPESGLNIEKGHEARLLVDESRRRLNSRLHSAGHLLDLCMEKVGLGHLEPVKGYHFPDGPFVEYKGSVTQDESPVKVKELEVEANKLISQGGKVYAAMLPYEEASMLCGGSLPDYIPKGSTPRILRLGENNRGCPCGGTHVSNIYDIGSMKVTRMRTKKGMTKIFYNIAS